MQQNNCKTRAGRRARSRLARVLTMLALLLCVSTGAWAQTETYTVRMMDGTKDAGNWTMASGEKSATGSDPDGLTGLRENDPVNLTYSGRQKVKGVKAKVVNPLETPLTVEALTAGRIQVSNPRSGMQYSKNGEAKQSVSGDIPVVKGDKVAFYGSGKSINSYYVNTQDRTKMMFTGKNFTCKVYGNIMSLVDEQDFATNTTLTAENAFRYFFSNNDKLTDASGLLLPATTLTNYCYGYMFSGCTALTAAPELPALTLADRCYSYMFQDCTALTTVPAELPATTLSIYCYYCMFKNCTALESAPVLPATKLPTACYRQMFSGCSMLSAVTCLATNIRAINCTYEWLDGVASQGTFTKAAAADWSVKTGTSGIPSGWTVQNASDN